MLFQLLKKDGKKVNNTNDLVSKIQKMNLTDIRAYLNNNIKDFHVTQEGLVAVMRLLTSVHEESNRRFIERDDTDIKIKKAFDIVIGVAKHKKLTVEAVEEIQTFIQMYEDLITNYDTQNKQIYREKLTKACNNGIEMINKRLDVTHKMSVLGK